MTGERVPHPDDPAAVELYALLVLTSGPWTEARYRTAAPRVVLAKHWMTFVESLKASATVDLDSAALDLREQEALMNAKTAAQRHAIGRNQVMRAKTAIAKAREQRTEVRKALLLDED